MAMRRELHEGLTRRTFLGWAAAGLGGATTLPALLEACSGGGAPQKVSGGTTASHLKLAIGGEPSSLDPMKGRSNSDFYYTNQVFEGLLAYDQQGKVVPALATSYTRSPDATQYTFDLRPGVKWHNGDPFTADDVAFSFQRYVSPAIANPLSYNLADFKSADVLSPTRVRINLSSPDPILAQALGYTTIVPKNYITTKGDAYFAQNPVGTGPFTFVSRTIKQSLNLKRFDGYWGPKPGYGGLDYQFVEDNASRLETLLAGQADFINSVPPANAGQISGNKSTKVVSGFDGIVFWVGFNLKTPGTPWQQQTVRQALSMAVDRQAMINRILHGYGVPFTGLTPFDKAYDTAKLSNPPYDPGQAKTLLKQAGFPNGFEIGLFGPADSEYPNSAELTEAVAGYWSDIGLKVNTQIVTQTAWVDQQASFQPNVVTGAYLTDLADYGTGDPVSRLQYHFLSTRASTPLTDPQLDQLIKAAAVAVAPADRNQAQAAVFRYINEHFYAINLYGEKTIYGLASSVDWAPTYGIGFPMFKFARPAASA